MNNETMRREFEEWYKKEISKDGPWYHDAPTESSLAWKSLFAKGAYAAYGHQQKEVERLRGLFERVKKIAEYPPQDKAILGIAIEALEQTKDSEA